MKKTIALLSLSFILSTNLFAQGGDPWIKKVYNDTWGRDPEGIEWNISNYNGGKWNNYTELMKAIYEWRKNMAAANITFQTSVKKANGNAIVGIYQNNVQIAVDLVNVSNGGIVASGAGNIVASGAGNIVASGAGNIISTNGSGISIDKSMKGANFGSSYTLAAEGVKVIKTSGSGALIIK